ncbi:MAG: YfiR family protein [Desulfobulbaceae bacterium]|nr:YfiR family protein [Desulfobulbaceae bacterium]
MLWGSLAYSSLYTAQANAEPMPSKRQLESAFLYNFLLFVHWPEEEKVAEQSTMTICILGDQALGDSFTPVEGKAIKSSKYILKVKNIRLPLYIADLKDCALLYIDSRASDALPSILSQIKELPILTVSDQADFAEKGGMLALVEKGNKLRWRINQEQAGRAGLRFDAQLLRNAESVIPAKQEVR